MVLGEGVVWYSSQFWALFYLQTVSKVDTLSSSFIVGIGLVIGTPSLIFFGWLSDKIGRVQAVRLNETGAEAVLQMDSDVHVPANLDAQVHSVSAVG